jgi:hypothetical protein
MRKRNSLGRSIWMGRGKGNDTDGWKEDQNTLYVLVWKQHNEIHQTLLKEGGGGRKKEEENERVNLLKVHCTHVWNYHSV